MADAGLLLLAAYSALKKGCRGVEVEPETEQRHQKRAQQ
jgi:hypothetical protein